MMRSCWVCLGFFFSSLPSLLACEGCKQPSSVAGDGGIAGISTSFSLSVLFMLTMIGGIGSGLIWMMIRSCRQLAAKQRVSAPELPIA